MSKIILTIRKLALSLALFAAALLPVLYTAPAHAQATRTWVSGVGDDANPCSRTAPCKTFAGAISKTSTGGEINCLDPGGFGALTITNSIIIDCHEALGGVLVAGTNGFSITGGTFVTLRNLIFDGATFSGLTGISITGATTVNIEDCVIEGFSQRGINDARTAGATQLTVKNTIVRNNTGSGISLAAAAKNSVVLDNVQSVANAYGVAAATGNIVVVNRSVMSENSIAGVYADPGATIIVDSSVISHNQTAGVQANGTVALSNSDITFNTSSISGATTSYGNNRIFGNGAGTTPTTTAQQ